jgi:hypothetical protein
MKNTYMAEGGAKEGVRIKGEGIRPRISKTTSGRFS